MTEQELNNGAAQFFGKHPVGVELRRRWDHRVQELTKQLVYETDPVKITNLQGKIQYHKEVLQEVGI
jgi:hypothetical protein